MAVHVRKVAGERLVWQRKGQKLFVSPGKAPLALVECQSAAAARGLEAALERESAQLDGSALGFLRRVMDQQKAARNQAARRHGRRG